MSFPTSKIFTLKSIKTLFIIEMSFTIPCVPTENSKTKPRRSLVATWTSLNHLSLTHTPPLLLKKPSLFVSNGAHRLSLARNKKDNGHVVSCRCRKRVLRRFSHQMSPQLKGYSIGFHRVQISCHLIINSSCILISVPRPAEITGVLTSKGGLEPWRDAMGESCLQLWGIHLPALLHRKEKCFSF